MQKYNKMMYPIKQKILLTAITFSFSLFTFTCVAQNLWINNGATIMNTSSVHIVVNGGVMNQNNGTFDNSGTMHVFGDWTNNAANTNFINSSPGKVNLEGNIQQISGTNATTFNILELSGTGTKQLRLVSTTIEDSLILNDREFDLDTNTAYETNTNIGIITRTTGFCSSLVNGGLARNTNSTGAYVFPVGSSVGTPRYRPIDMTPNNTTANTYKVRMANVDATTESYNITNTDSTLCRVNTLFYHRIYQLTGSSSADITMYYDSLADGYYNTAAHWQNSPRWEDMLNTTNVYNATPIFSTVTKSAWNNFLPYYPYALALTKPTVLLSTIPTTPTVCQNDTIEFHATSGMINYDFYVNGVLVQSSADSILIANNLNTGDTVFVMGSDLQACDGISNQITNIIINPLPAVTATALPTSTLCVGDTLTLSGGGATTYTWSPTVTNNTPFVVAASNTYIVTGTDGNGCADTAQIAITVNTLPTVTATALPTSTLCVGDTLTLLGGGATTYTWSPTVTNNTPFIVAASNTYIVTGTDGNGCADTAQIAITVNTLPTVTINAVSNSLCLGDSTPVSATGTATSYTWNDNSTITNFVFSPTTDSTLILTGIDANGCSNMDTALITVVPSPIIIASNDTSICFNEIVQLSASGTNITTVIWNNGNSLNDSTILSPLASPLTTTTYIVSAINGSCSSTDTLLVTVLSNPSLNAGNDTTITLGESVTINATTNGTSFIWTPIDWLSCTTCQNPIASPETTTEYYVTVTDINGCKTTDTLLINVDINCSADLFVPNIFTPNGDGDNDVIYVYNQLCVQEMNFMIFDRWGNKVYKSTDPSQGWDGQYKGKRAESGVYVYVLQATLVSGNSITKKGNITLLK